jgi:thioredoxin reductase
MNTNTGEHAMENQIPAALRELQSATFANLRYSNMTHELNGKTGKTQIVILGGGFAGVETARYLDRTAAKRSDVEVTCRARCPAFSGLLIQGKNARP